MGPVPKSSKTKQKSDNALLAEAKANFSMESEASKHSIHQNCIKILDNPSPLYSNEQAGTQIGKSVNLAKYTLPLMSSENPFPQKTDVFFSATYFGAKGGIDIGVSGQLFNLFVPRSVASNYAIDQTQMEELSKVLYIDERIAEFIIRNAFPPVKRNYPGMDKLIAAVQSDIHGQMEDGDWKNIANYTSSDGEKGIRAYCRDRIIAHLPELSDLSNQQKEELSLTVTRLSHTPIRVTHYIDNNGEPEYGALTPGLSDQATLERYEKVDGKLMDQAILLGLKESDAVGREMGLSGKGPAPDIGSNIAVYYDSRYWSSGQGMSMLLSQVRTHAKTMEEAFLSSTADARYLQLPLDTYKSNLVSASNQYSNSGDFTASIRAVTAEMRVYESSLATLYGEVEAYAKSQAGSGAKIGAKEIDAAFSHLYASDASFKSHLDAVHVAVSGFTKKYSVARLYGPGGSKSNQNTSPTAVAKGLFGDPKALPQEQIAGYMAADYAMNYIGRGMDISVGGDITLQKIDFVTDQKDSKVVMGIGGKPNSGQATSVLVFRVDKDKSIVVEDPDQMKEDITTPLAPALSARGAFIDTKKGISFSETGQYRIYSVPIASNFTLKTKADANALDIQIDIPSSFYSKSSELIPVLKLTAKTPDLSERGIITGPDEEPGYFAAEVRAAVSGTNIVGNRKQFARGGSIDNASGSELTGQISRDESTGAIQDLFSAVSYDYLSKSPVNSRLATYYSDFNKRPEDWVASNLMQSDASDFNKNNSNLSPSDYLAAFKKTIDKKIDSYIKEGIGENASEAIKNDKKLAGVSPDSMNSIADIESWSPLHSHLAYWSAYKGALIQLKQTLDPSNPVSKQLIDKIDGEIKIAAARYVSSPINDLAPDVRRGVEAQGDMYEAMMRVNAAAREQGISAIFYFKTFGRQTRLQATLSQGIGPTDDNILAQVVTSPQAGINAKLSNATMLLFDYLINLANYKNDDTLFRMDFHVEFNLTLVPNYRKYDYNYGVQSLWSNGQSGVFDIFAAHRLDPENIGFAALQEAATLLLAKLLPDDRAGRSLCRDIISLCDQTHVVNNRGQALADKIAKLDAIIKSPKYLGGTTSDFIVKEGTYNNNADKYIGRDALPINGPIPDFIARVDFHFEKENTSLFGLLPLVGVDPESAGIRAKVTGSVFLPVAFDTLVTSPWIPSNSVAGMVRDQAKQVFWNWVPPVNFRAQLDKAINVTSNYVVSVGGYIAGDATAAVVNDVGIDVKNALAIPSLNTILSLDLTGRLIGLQLGELAPSYEVRAGFDTKFTENLRLNAQFYDMFRQYPHGSANCFGFNVGLSLYFNSPPVINDEAARINPYEQERTRQRLLGAPPKSDENETK